MKKILLIPGSLRSSSSSNHVLRAVSAKIPPQFTTEVFDGIGDLPHFNDADSVPETVLNFRTKIKEADAILICTPEYAFGIPGSLKNALDWTVSSGEFVNKPVALITASSQGEKAHAALLLVLSAISCNVIDGATLLVSFIRSKIDAQGNIKDPALDNELERCVEVLINSTK